MSFKNLNLKQEIVQALEEKGYKEATPIQEKTIPLIIKGHDILASAQTGTGKTAGFTVPLLQVLMDNTKNEQNHFIRALILTPTRELAAQVGESVKTYGAHLPLKSQVVYGGVNINRQIQKLHKGTDILVATPGRLLDLVSQDIINLSKVEILVLDEADRMLDMGFIHDLRKILKLLPLHRQNLLFSATFSDKIKALASSILRNPQIIEVAKQNTPSELVKHIVYPVDRERKRELLALLINTHQWEQVLVFTRTKHGANKLVKQLCSDGIISEAIHANKSQSARTKSLADFKAKKIRVLVATDIAARGLDITQLPCVVNFELPHVPEDYVHRIGRTGRSGNQGWACSLVCIDEHKLQADIEKLLKRKIEIHLQPGFDVDPSIPAEPIQNGRNGRNMPKVRQAQPSDAKKAPSSPRRQNASRPKKSEKQESNFKSKPKPKS